MAYDFPASPVNDDEYTPPVGGQTYIFKAPRWLVKGIPPAGEGGGGGGIDEAPIDGKIYGRYETLWMPTVHKDQYDETIGMLADNIAAKSNIASPTFTGDPKAPTPAAADNDTSIATTAFVQAAVAPLATDIAARVLKAGDTMTGKLVTAASTTARAGINIPTLIGAPSAPVDGDMWATSAALTMRLGGTSRIFATLSAAQTFTGLQTFSGKITLPGSSTVMASIVLPHGAAPTTPANGDMWTTTLGLYVHVNGATVGPLGAGGGGVSQSYVDTADALRVLKAGDTMTGTLTVLNVVASQNGSAALPAFGQAGLGLMFGTNTISLVTGGSVRAQVQNTLLSMLVPIQLPAGNPTDPAHAASKDYVDSQISGVYSLTYSRAQSDARYEMKITAGTTAQFWRGDKSWQPLPAQDWATLTGKPATFPPTLPIAESDVTNLVTDLAAKEPVIAGGTTSQFWRGDKSWQTLPPSGIAEAPVDGKQYGRKNAAWTEIVAPVGGAVISDTPPGSPTQGQLWWNSATGDLFISFNDGNTTQWVQVNG